ncbi:ribonuclease HII [Microvirga brassicacearum]|uniref:Ribonuclease HII n=1 Tax=Microvirga brassicacearum TaxID=2580413 RepID=A0A5N3P448_9HYPH|nr:ribonuclease HII [Microvirga brassicacearum]KAB0264493.1 ribonuclease HII [Microvirga brassicacearum]
MSEPIRLPPPDIGLKRERALRRAGFQCVAGLDEVGRGPLAGPVVSAAVVLDLKKVPSGLADSKALTAEQREALFEQILTTAHVGIASISHTDVDSINIRQASLRAMCRALAALPCTPDMALVDGNDPPALPCRVEAVIKGDASIASIAAASIVAKVVRDRLMVRLGAIYPSYGFHTNVGYATKFHLSALASDGPSPFHRMTFSPLRQGLLDL